MAQMIQTKSYTFDNLSQIRKQVKRPEHCTAFFFSKLHAIKTDLYDKLQTYPFWICFKADIVGAAHATEEPHNICYP